MYQRRVAGIKVVIHHPKISAVLIVAAKYSVISFLPVKHLPPLWLRCRQMAGGEN